MLPPDLLLKLPYHSPSYCQLLVSSSYPFLAGVFWQLF